MNVFWKTILTAVVTIAAIVSARYSAQWLANHTFRADRYDSRPMARSSYVPPPSSHVGRNYAERRHPGAPRP